MNAILIGMSAIVGIGLGWYGYKAHLRIEAWGRNMNECDEIFRMASGEAAEEVEGLAKDARRAGPLSRRGLHPETAASK